MNTNKVEDGVEKEAQVNSVAGEYLTKKEAANLLKVSVRTFESWLRRGFVGYLRIGRTIRLRRVDVEALLDEKFRVGPCPSNFHRLLEGRNPCNENLN